MTVHFAAAQSPARSPIARILARPYARHAANDNPRTSPHIGANSVFENQTVRAALQLFARHGLGAARQARTNAEDAFFAGDRAGYDWWLGICRALDTRVAAELGDSVSQEAMP